MTPDEDDEFDDPEAPDDFDVDDSDSVDLEPCPYCRKPIYDRAEYCPRCGNYISREEKPNRKPMWFVIAALIALGVILLVWVL